jgi:hypothetical protein
MYHFESIMCEFVLNWDEFELRVLYISDGLEMAKF